MKRDIVQFVPLRQFKSRGDPSNFSLVSCNYVHTALCDTAPVVVPVSIPEMAGACFMYNCLLKDRRVMQYLFSYD